MPRGGADLLTKEWSPKLVSMRTLRASDFKAQCLAVLDEVAETGEAVVITKHGSPVAQLLPFLGPDPSPQETLHGTVTFMGDVMSPAVDEEAWDALQGKLV
jgi:prevent-host-death family protein